MLLFTGPLPLGRRLRMLIVDDEEGIRTVLKRLLVRFPSPPPVEIDTAQSAEEALAIMQERSYDVILSDYKMGGLDGVSFLVEALARSPATARILMTGYLDDEVKRNAEELAHTRAVVRKPWDTPELLTLVRSVLDEKRDTA